MATPTSKLPRIVMRTIFIAFCCLGAGVVPSAALADLSKRVTFDIAAQQLPSALLKFAAQSGVQVTSPGGLIEGKTSAGAVGTFDALEALQRILKDTNLRFDVVNENTVLIVIGANAPTAARSPAADEGQGVEPRHLQLVQAQTSAQSARPDERTEAANPAAAAEESGKFSVDEVTVSAERYGATVTTVGRLAVPYIDTPQAASVVTSELLQDAKLFDSNSALMFVPSVKNDSGILNTQIIRGIVTSNTYSDGFRNTPNTSFDTFFSDRIEVVKGPSSSSFGRGDPAGFVNYITKHPTFKQGAEAGLLFGTGNSETHTYRMTLDHNGFVTADERTAYRFVSMYDQGAQSMQYSDYRKRGAQLAVAHKLDDDRGRLDFVAHYSSTGHPGLIRDNSYNSLPYRRFYEYFLPQIGFSQVADFLLPDGDRQLALDRFGFDQNVFRATASLDLKLGEHWRMRQAANFVNTDSQGATGGFGIYSVYAGTNGDWMVDAFAYPYLFIEHRRSWQTDFLGNYDIPGIGASVSFLAGADVNKGDYVNGFADTATASVPQVVGAWNPHVKVGPFLEDPRENALVTDGSDWSAYVQGQIKFLDDRIQLTASARRIWQDTDTTSGRTGAVTTNDQQSPILPTYSILVKPLEWLSVYATVAEHIEPAKVQPRYFNLAGADFPPDDPLRAATISLQPTTHLDEFGAKANFFDQQLTLSLAYYKVKNSGSSSSIAHAYTNNAGNPAFYSEAVETNNESHGWEIEGFGHVGRRFTYLFGGVLGTGSSQTAVWQGSLFTGPVSAIGDSLYGYATYSFGPDRYNGLSLTAGWKTYFSGYILTFTPVPQRFEYPDDEHILDLGVSYGFRDKYQFYVKGNNLLHEDALPHSQQSLIPGRQVFAGVDVRF